MKFYQIGTPQWVDALAHYGNKGVNSLSQEHNDTLSSSQTKS